MHPLPTGWVPSCTPRDSPLLCCSSPRLKIIGLLIFCLGNLLFCRVKKTCLRRLGKGMGHLLKDSFWKVLVGTLNYNACVSLKLWNCIILCRLFISNLSLRKKEQKGIFISVLAISTRSGVETVNDHLICLMLTWIVERRLKSSGLREEPLYLWAKKIDFIILYF